MLGALITRSPRLAAFTVHEPPAQDASVAERAESLVFVRDGFSWLAALFSPLYLVMRGEWRALVLYLAVSAVLLTVLQAIGARADWIGWSLLLLNLIVGFEMSELRRWSLGRAGWRQIATVNGAGQDEAERRFFEAWIPTLAVSPSSPLSAPPQAFSAPYPAAAHAPLAAHAPTVDAPHPLHRLAARIRRMFGL